MKPLKQSAVDGNELSINFSARVPQSLKQAKEEEKKKTEQNNVTKRERKEMRDKGRNVGSTCCDFHQSGTRSSAEVKSDTDLEGNTAR